MTSPVPPPVSERYWKINFWIDILTFCCMREARDVHLVTQAPYGHTTPQIFWAASEQAHL